MPDIQSQPGLFGDVPSNVITASRRTDIPAFYMPWLMNCLRRGSDCYANQSHSAALERFRAHDPRGDMLVS